jgi:hypothetical protein
MSALRLLRSLWFPLAPSFFIALGGALGIWGGRWWNLLLGLAIVAVAYCAGTLAAFREGRDRLLAMMAREAMSEPLDAYDEGDPAAEREGTTTWL